MTGEDAVGSNRAGVSARVALIAFFAVEVAGAVIYVVNGRKVWFFGVFGDEWDFLAGRRATVHDLLLRHGDHLVALPALVFRILYTAFGLRTYLPYQLCAIGLHLAAAALLRVVMRRAGVDPWIATAAAGAFVLFGAGSQDILIAFQITFSGALVLGLVQLLLVDHAGPIDRRDGLALLAGLGALLCSDIAFVMIAAAGVAALARGRWRAALLQVVPLSAVYIAWLVGYGRSARTNTDISRIVTSARTTLSSTFGALAQVPFLGWALAAMLVAGAVLAAVGARRSGTLSTLTAPGALALAAPLFALMLALTRFGLGAHFAASSRYLHVVAALVLPALAVAADALARRWRVAAPAVVALLLIGVPGNIGKIGDNVAPAERYREQRRVISTLPALANARDTPRSLHPTPSFAAEVTVGWLLDAQRDGRIPTERPASARERATDRLRLSIEQLDGSHAASCTPLRGTVTRRLAPGASFGIVGTILVQSIPRTGTVSAPLPFGAGLLATARTHTLRAVSGPLTLRIAPLPPAAALC
jgi:hypothetical protein